MGLIPEDIITELRDRADIVAVIGRHVNLRKAGRNHKGLCPFHHEKTPSFNVNGDKGFFYCFGCQKKGDVFSFLMEYEGKSFVEAAEMLASLTGVTLPEPGTGGAGAGRRGERAELLETNRLAAAFYRQTLADPGRGRAGRDYLASRGIGDAVADAFQLGLAPASWSALADFLSGRGASTRAAEKVGLIAPRPRSGGHYDRFRNRLMCPVMSAAGDVVGFSGRLLATGDAAAAAAAGDAGPGAGGAKYINSPESPVYKKSRLLFGLYQARDAFRRKGRAILVEGNFDVISLHQAGFDETVAPLGTALTPEQADQLRRLADRVVLLYDGDRAGRAATLKALKTLVAADATVYIASIPPGEDPDSLVVQGGPAALSAVLDRAQPAVEYFIWEVWSHTGRSADDRARALAEAADVVKSVQDHTKRDLILGTLATALETDLAVVRRALGRTRAAAPPQRPAEAGRDREDNRVNPSGSPTFPLPAREELDIVALLAEHPGLLATAEERDVFSFLTDSRLRDMYSAAREGGPMLSAAPPDLTAEIAKRVLAGDYASLTDPAHTLEGMVANLRRSRLLAEAAELQRQAEEAQRRGDTDRVRELSHKSIAIKRQVD